MNDKGERQHTILSEHFGEHPNIGDIRGRGLFFGLEFVMDRETKRPFPPGKGIPAKLKKAAMAHRLICNQGGGDVDGRVRAELDRPLVDLVPVLLVRLRLHVDGRLGDHCGP